MCNKKPFILDTFGIELFLQRINSFNFNYYKNHFYNLLFSLSFSNFFIFIFENASYTVTFRKYYLVCSFKKLAMFEYWFSEF